MKWKSPRLNVVAPAAGAHRRLKIQKERKKKLNQKNKNNNKRKFNSKKL